MRSDHSTANSFRPLRVLLPRVVDALLGPEPVRSPATVHFWHRQLGPRARLLDLLAAEFNRLRPDLTVLVESRAEAERLAPAEVPLRLPRRAAA